jgi:hypothetical protein
VWGLVAGAHMDEPALEQLIASGVERVVEDWAEAAALFRKLPNL